MYSEMTIPNWKMIYLARRNPTLAPEDFPQAWREHSALGRNCLNVQDRVRSVTQCVRLLDDTSEGTSTGYDGVNLLLLRDRQSADAIWTDPETLAIMRPDEPRVFDRYVRDFTLVAREQVVLDGPVGDAVLVGFLKRRARVEPADFERALGLEPTPWTEVRRTVLNLVEPQRPVGYDFDAIMEWWFDDAAHLAQALASQPLATALPVLHHTVCEPAASLFMATRVSHRRP
jgi:EthD domain